MDKEVYICNLCGSEKSVLMFEGNLTDNLSDKFSQYSYYGDIFKCSSCGLVSQRLSHDLDEVVECLKKETYLDESIGELNLSEKTLQFNRLISIVDKYVSLDGCKVLDVGANTGLFLNLMRRYSDDLAGIEPSEEAASVARERFGLKVQNCLVSEALLEDSCFDVITMWDVVEHLLDPSSDLSFLYDKLSPGGAIFITTHDVGSFFAKVAGRHYPMFMYQHFFHFSRETLTKMLIKNRFEILGVDYFNKTWTLNYLYHLSGKLWPASPIAKFARSLLKPVVELPALSQLPVTIPIRDFFMVAARRPIV